MLIVLVSAHGIFFLRFQIETFSGLSSPFEANADSLRT